MARVRLFAAAMLAAVIVAAVAGCSTAGRFRATLPEVPGDYRVDTQPVELIDLTGLVTDLEPVADPLLPPGAWPDNAAGIPYSTTGVPGEPLAVHVVWGAGMCEDRTRLTLEDAETGYALRIEHDNSIGGMPGCPAAMVLRGAILRFREAVTPGSIAVSVEMN